jgi:hypothetical protein
MRLYGVLESEIEETIKHPDLFKMESMRSIAIKQFRGRFDGFPLKVIYVIEDKATVVISAYPYERGY